MQIDDVGEMFYFVAYGFFKVGIFDVDELESYLFMFFVFEYIEVIGGGFSGLVLDQVCNCLFVLIWFDNSIFVIDIVIKVEISYIVMYNLELDFIVKGRLFLYDVCFSFGCGDLFCVSCYLFGDNDGLVWDLGDLDNVWIVNLCFYFSKVFLCFVLCVYYLMKGFMVI